MTGRPTAGGRRRRPSRRGIARTAAGAARLATRAFGRATRVVTLALTPAFARAACMVAMAASPALGQATDEATVRIELGASPRVVSVGEPFASAVRVIAPAGVRVEPGGFSGGDTVQALGVPRVDEEGAGVTAVYRLVAWVAGEPLEATVPVRLVGSSGAARVQLVRLALPEVRSVLPAGEAAIEPRPAKGLLEPPAEVAGLAWWWWALALLGALLAAAGGYALLRRRAEEETSMPTVSPRDWALRHLDALDRAGDGTLESVTTLHARASRVLRTYLDLLDPTWGADLTSTEVVAAFGGSGGGAAELAGLLAAADRVKFAGQAASPAEAREYVAAVRGWIVAYPEPAGATEPGRAA